MLFWAAELRNWVAEKLGEVLVIRYQVKILLYALSRIYKTVRAQERRYDLIPKIAFFQFFLYLCANFKNKKSFVLKGLD